MNQIQSKKLKIVYETMVDGSNKSKTKTYNKINLKATDENLLKCGELIADFIQGDNKELFKVEESRLS